eukprot:8369035-Pyramimonas_sp.AAC.1
MHGDHLTLLNACRAFRQTPNKQRKEWCFDNFVNVRAMGHAEHVYQQLRGHCEGLRFPMARYLLHLIYMIQGWPTQ